MYPRLEGLAGVNSRMTGGLMDDRRSYNDNEIGQLRGAIGRPCRESCHFPLEIRPSGTRMEVDISLYRGNLPCPLPGVPP